MTDDDTAAIRRLEAAIEAALTEHLAAGGHGEPAILTDWALVSAAHIDPGTGDTFTGYNITVRPGQPMHVTIGLLDYQLTRRRAIAAGNADLDHEDR